MIHLTIRKERVPALGFGTWELTGRECVQGVEDALAVGYRHLDTAEMYRNEAEVGEGIRNSGVPREEIFLVTKVLPEHFARDRTIRAARESLRKLGTDYVDLLLMHSTPSGVPLEETLGAMRELQDEGSVRHIGVSNFPPPMVEQATRHAHIFCNQVEFHPFNPQDALITQAREMDYLFTAYSPLAQGDVLDDAALKQMGEAHGKTPAQVALRWILQQGLAAIPRSSSDEHRRANFDVFDFELSDAEMRAVSALSH
ncbi:aldo/keto reductase [soil metagenome]